MSTAAQPQPVCGRFFLPDGYVERLVPDYFVNADRDGRTWQPHVYPLAGALARRGGCRRIIDVGCGRARKLADMRPEFVTIGIDYGSNLESCRTTHSTGTWLEMDLEHPWGLDLSPADIASSVVICADVIEHLKDPTELLKALSALGQTAEAVLLSTPERVRTWGRDHLGPPPNPAHVREWSLDELVALVSSHGLAAAFAGVTASEDETLAPKTSLIVASLPRLNETDRRSMGEFCRDTLRALYERDGRSRQQRLVGNRRKAVGQPQPSDPIAFGSD